MSNMAKKKSKQTHSLRGRQRKEHMSTMAKEQKTRTQTHPLRARQRETTHEQHGKGEKYKNTNSQPKSKEERNST
jgi:hypothetical protein